MPRSTLWLMICAIASLWSRPLHARATWTETGWTTVDPSITPIGFAVSSPPSLAGISGGGAQELGQTAILQVVINGTIDPTLSYQWSKNSVDISGATAASYTIAAVTAADAGTYRVTVSNLAGSSVASTDLSVKSAAAPVITNQPSNSVVSVGQQVVFSFIATGSYPRTYQWRKDGNAISGATQATYTIGSVVTTDAGTYSVVITNSLGSATSTAASLTVNAAIPPVISSSYPYDNTVTQGAQVSLSVYLNSGSSPFTYQWFKNGTIIPGATSSYLTFNAIALTDAGNYSVKVTNAAGSATSRQATIIVNAATAPTVSTQPQSQTIYVGQSVNFYAYFNGSSPMTYQWLKNGAAIPGATSNSFNINPAVLADAASYSVTATNVAGSATTVGAVLTVNPAVAPTITTQPVSQTVDYYGTINLTVQVSGSSPLTYQWKKDGVPLSSGSSSSYYFSSATTANSGVYTVVVTNSAGSVTSSGVTVTVNPAVAPTITTQPVSQTVDYYGYINLSVQASGSGPLTYQWKKDGVSLGSGSSNYYSFSNATAANSGVYTVIVTNSAGAVTSNAATVTVKAAIAPTITQQPVAVQVAVGLSTSLSVSYNSTGTGSLTVQWQKNGVAIAGATYNSYSISNVKDADAGDYTVVITGPGGTVTSAAAKLTVLPPAPPSVQSWPYGSSTVTLGTNVSLSVSGVSGTGPFNYQWYKDGIAIAGATSSTLSFTRVSEGDLGTYIVAISNAGGIIASPPITLQLSSSNSGSAAPWLDATRLGNTIYFLATSPSRIERYDLAAERWLTTTILSETQVPTAFLPTSEGTYVAYGRTLVRRSPDLATETPITNVTNNITLLYAYDDLLYYNNSADGSSSSSTFATIRRSTLQAGPVNNFGYSKIVFATRSRVGYATGGYYTYDPVAFTIGTDGKFTLIPGTVGYSGDIPTGTRLFLFPNEDYVANDGGTILRASDLSYVGSFGNALTDLVFLSDGTPVGLRNRTLQAIGATDFLDAGQTTVSFTGVRAFSLGTSVFVFGAPGGSSVFQVAKVLGSAYAKRALPSVTVSPGDRFSVDDVFFSPDGVVHVFSRSLQALVRWSAQTCSFLPPVPLRGQPRLSSQTGSAGRALFFYDDGQITEAPLRAGDAAERQIATVGNRVWGLTDMDNLAMLNIYNYSSSADRRMVLGPQGQMLYLSGWSYWGAGWAWQSAIRRLYSEGRFSYDNTVEYETVPASGVLPAGTNQTSNSVANIFPPLRFNPEGTLVATGNGRVLNADLAQVGVLANNILDAAWLTNGLYTLRSLNGDAQVQQWARTTYLQTGALTIRGTPIRLFRLSDTQLVVVTSLLGYLNFALVNADLSVVSPPVVAGYAGVYFGKLGSGGTAGDFALSLYRDRPGVMLVNLTGTNSAILVTNFAVAADGSFVVTGTALDSGVARVISGKIAADGSLSGTIAGLNLSLTGSEVSGAGLSSGFYQATAVSGGSGAAYAIVAPDGRALVVAKTSTAVDGGVGTIAANGNVTVSTARGATLQTSVGAGTGTFAVAAANGVFVATVFGGVRDDVVHTDRLFGISTRGRAGTGDNIMIAGFVVTGTTPLTVLIRAVGPGLAGLGVSGALADSRLDLYRGSTKMLSSDNWGSEPGASAIAATAARLGDFSLPSNGKDAALLVTLDPGLYTAMVGSTDGSTGVALAEVYDASDNAPVGSAQRLVSISTRAYVGTGDETLTAGISISGNAPKRVLIRAIGPTLGSFGVSGVLPDPVLTLYSGTTAIAQNDDWGGGSDIIQAGVRMSAFALPSDSKDACILITLAPGTYSAQVSGKAGAAGVALVEVYEIPQ